MMYVKKRGVGRDRTRLAERRQFIDTLKASPCVDCQRWYPAFCMDFDHVRGVKRWTVSRMVECSVASILRETSLCDLVCANCHRVRTERRRRKTTNPRKQIFNERIAQLKQRPCSSCEETFPQQAMEFDHRRGVKASCIAQMHDSPWSKVLTELQKCELICACCHRKRTHESRPAGGWFVSTASLEKRKRRRQEDARLASFREAGLALLGMLPDPFIGYLFDVHASSVWHHRQRLQIPAYEPDEEWLGLLGTMSDARVASAFGKNPEVVRRKRNSLGIRPFRDVRR